MMLKKAIKQGWKEIWIPLVCGLAALVAILAIGLIAKEFFSEFFADYNPYFVGIAAGVSAVVAAVLVGIIIMQTIASRQQAEASVKMAKAMVKPTLIPYLNLIGDFDGEREVRFKAGVNNDGNGPAYDIRFKIQDSLEQSSSTFTFETAPPVSVLRGHNSTSWLHPDPKLPFPHSDKVQRRFLVIKYRDTEGEYEIRLPFVLTTDEEGKPYARPEAISKEIISKINLEDELP